MGKEWFYWVVGGGGGNRKRDQMKEEGEGGCMCAAFHIFNVHRFQLPSTHRSHSKTALPSFQEEEASSTATGVEAPRNSLEATMDAAASLMPLPMKLQQKYLDLNFPVEMKIKTSHGRISSSKSKARSDDICSECNSPKTPSVVARLMGLDLLPPTQCASPSLPKSRKDSTLLQRSFLHDHLPTRSLPETPRTSSSSRQSDVERHRLSLQINKENSFREEEISLSDHKIAGRRRRSVGADITNSIRVSQNSTRDQNILLPHKPSKKNSKTQSKFGEPKEVACRSPRLRVVLSENNNNNNNIKATTAALNKTSRKEEVSRLLNHIPLVKEKQQHKKDSSNLAPRAAVRSRKDEGYVRNKFQNKSNKTTPLSSCVKNVPSPPHNQSQVSNAPPPSKIRAQKARQSYDKHQPQLLHDKVVTAATPCSIRGGASPEQRNYIHIILKDADVINQVSPLVNWHTPIDLGVFHHLELKAAVEGCNTVLSRRCERKLLCHLVDEMLAEHLTQRLKLKRWITPLGDDGSSRLVEEICKKIDSFPAAKCEVVEDIHSLIDKDLCKLQSNGFWGEEEDIVGEIEGHIVEWLMCDAVAAMGGDAGAELTDTDICYVKLPRGETPL